MRLCLVSCGMRGVWLRLRIDSLLAWPYPYPYPYEIQVHVLLYSACLFAYTIDYYDYVFVHIAYGLNVFVLGVLWHDRGMDTENLLVRA